MLMEIKGQETVSGRKNPFRTFYIAVMHYGVWGIWWSWLMTENQSI